MEYEVYSDPPMTGSQWLWSLKRDGKTVAKSGRRYATKANCLKAIKRMQTIDRSKMIAKRTMDGKTTLSGLNHFPLAIIEGKRIPSFKTKKFRVVD